MVEPMPTQPTKKKPEIELSASGYITRNGYAARVVFTKDSIEVGCSIITIEAAKKLLAEHKKAYSNVPEQVVFQEGVK